MKQALGGVLCAVVVSLAATDAWSCGGCFHAPTLAADSVVTGHRMAFAVAGDRTVLWDQIKYTGSPQDFAWVLPVRPGAYVETSTDAWFETLDALTTANVTAPNIACAQPSYESGCGLGGSADSGERGSASDDSNFDGTVHVIHEGTVGPYETVTLSSSSGESLRTWLAGHGYVVPPDIDPVIDSYVAEGADFIALRLSPGRGVSSMQPVRVVTPGGPAMLPLRMVAAGTGQFVDIVLYVIGEGRYQLDDFEETFIDASKLKFDMTANSSNYLTVREDALGQNGGYSFLTAFATSQPFSASGDAYSAGDGFSSGALADVYFRQAAANDARPLVSDCGTVSSLLQQDLLVGEGTGGGIDATALSCGEYTDLTSALTGLHPARTWLTRLELDLPREALGADCTVSLSKTQEDVSRNHTTDRVVNRTAACPEVIFRSGLIPPMNTRAAVCFWSAAALATLLGRRRGRNRRR